MQSLPAGGFERSPGRLRIDEDPSRCAGFVDRTGLLRRLGRVTPLRLLKELIRPFVERVVEVEFPLQNQVVGGKARPDKLQVMAGSFGNRLQRDLSDQRPRLFVSSAEATPKSPSLHVDDPVIIFFKQFAQPSRIPGCGDRLQRRRIESAPGEGGREFIPDLVVDVGGERGIGLPEMGGRRSQLALSEGAHDQLAHGVTVVDGEPGHEQQERRESGQECAA